MNTPAAPLLPRTVDGPASSATLHSQMPRGLGPLDTEAFTTHVAYPRPRGSVRTAKRSSRRWRPLAIATCVGALATLAGTAVWGFFPDEVAGSLSGLDRAIISLGTR